ncbi:hypothetical protein [Jannaschia sp. CCS1]|uniref:hypothetical protein n=1 Tax=Jannaschia sp. (strain CCS1) TaxID=290400 RepID=UPI000053B009|nr:hypothetical protein [Jannaschia sp. CCS1]ABD56716.1 hypothetical protein Jann_3799 [Jannaschia sp. CCS1]
MLACVGNGSYIFANPVTGHQIAETLTLPILTIVRSTAMRNAVRRSTLDSDPDAMLMTTLDPSPDFAQAACTRHVICPKRRQTLPDTRMAVSDAR